MKKFLTVVLGFSLLLMPLACTNMTKKEQGTVSGAAGGAAVGAVIGAIAGGRTGAAAGAAIGGVVGGVGGAVVGDHQEGQDRSGY